MISDERLHALTVELVQARAAAVGKAPQDAITDDTALQTLGIDSLALVVILIELQASAAITIDFTPGVALRTVGDIVKLARARGAPHSS